jgi:hypothetical protein
LSRNEAAGRPARGDTSTAAQADALPDGGAIGPGGRAPAPLRRSAAGRTRSLDLLTPRRDGPRRRPPRGARIRPGRSPSSRSRFPRPPDTPRATARSRAARATSQPGRGGTPAVSWSRSYPEGRAENLERRRPGNAHVGQEIWSDVYKTVAPGVHVPMSEEGMLLSPLEDSKRSKASASRRSSGDQHSRLLGSMRLITGNSQEAERSSRKPSSRSGSAAIGWTRQPLVDFPPWSPDGTRIAFEAGRRPNLRVQVLALASGTDPDLGSGFHPVWGARLGQPRDLGARGRLRDPRPQRAGPHRIVSRTSSFAAAWSPDAEWIVFNDAGFTANGG